MEEGIGKGMIKMSKRDWMVVIICIVVFIVATNAAEVILSGRGGL